MKNGVVFNKLPEMPDKIRKAASQIVRTGAFMVEAAAKRKAPVDTGFLRNSIYTVTSESSGGMAHQKAFPVMAPMSDPLHAAVVVGATYGIFLERGTRFQHAQPYLLPAALEVEPKYHDAWRRFEEMIR